MKVRTESDLLSRLDDEFAWRRKELTVVWSDVQTSSHPAKNARVRAGVALLYAHWEGFIKNSAELLIRFVSIRRLRHCDLAPGLLALAIARELSDLVLASSAEQRLGFVNFIRSEQESRAKLPSSGAVKTGANLNSSRLRDIVLTLGLDYSPYELKANMIDSQLLAWRNSIAHGRETCPTEVDFQTLYEEITALLRTFKDQIQNAVILKQYRL